MSSTCVSTCSFCLNWDFLYVDRAVKPGLYKKQIPNCQKFHHLEYGEPLKLKFGQINVNKKNQHVRVDDNVRCCK